MAQSNRFRGTNEDRLSDLPESLISQILSSMPTRDAVRTSVLSRDWEFKWTCISCINVCHERGTSHDKFIRFVNKVIMLTHNSKIRSFRLDYELFDSDTSEARSESFGTWIRALLQRNVEHLDVINAYHTASSRCFSGWTSLKELKLCLVCTLNVSTVNCFLNLRKLSLNGPTIKNEQQSSHHIVMNFPGMESLELRDCGWLDMDSVVIQAPVLITFEMFMFYADFGITILAPKLAKFNLQIGSVKHIIVSAPEVSHATLNLVSSSEGVFLASSILNGFQKLKRLALSGELVEALVQSNKLVRYTLDLVKEFEVFNGIRTTRYVLKLLQIMPSLESLSIDLQSYLGYNDEHVGECFPTLRNLKKVKFYMNEGEQAELDFAESLLKVTTNLESVYAYAYKQQDGRIDRHLSRLIPRDSNCILHVKERKSERMQSEE